MFQFFHGAPYSVLRSVEECLSLCVLFWRSLFVACVGVCRCGDVWRFVWWGNVGRVRTGRLYSV